VKGYCVDTSSSTINADVCLTKYLKVMPASGTRSIECGGIGPIDKCAICTSVDSFYCSLPTAPIKKADNEYIYTCQVVIPVDNK